jgi:hypothetical protein
MDQRLRAMVRNQQDEAVHFWAAPHQQKSADNDGSVASASAMPSVLAPAERVARIGKQLLPKDSSESPSMPKSKASRSILAAGVAMGPFVTRLLRVGFEAQIQPGETSACDAMGRLAVELERARRHGYHPHEVKLAIRKWTSTILEQLRNVHNVSNDTVASDLLSHFKYDENISAAGTKKELDVSLQLLAGITAADLAAFSASFSVTEAMRVSTPSSSFCVASVQMNTQYNPHKVHMHVHIHVHVCVCIVCMYVMCVCVHARACMCIPMYVYMYTHAYSPTYKCILNFLLCTFYTQKQKLEAQVRAMFNALVSPEHAARVEEAISARGPTRSDVEMGDLMMPSLLPKTHSRGEEKRGGSVGGDRAYATAVTTIPEVETTEIVLSNGISVCVKNTANLKAGHVSFQAFALGGCSELTEEEDLAFSVIDDVCQESGLLHLTGEEMGELQSQHKCRVNTQRHLFHRGIGGSCPKQHLELLLQLLFLKMTSSAHAHASGVAAATAAPPVAPGTTAVTATEGNVDDDNPSLVLCQKMSADVISRHLHRSSVFVDQQENSPGDAGR